MTIEEKLKLVQDLELLPTNKTLQAIQIVTNFNNNIEANNNNEFVCEIEDFDIETLWELDRLVTNWKKSRNKKARI